MIISLMPIEVLERLLTVKFLRLTLSKVEAIWKSGWLVSVIFSNIILLRWKLFRKLVVTGGNNADVTLPHLTISNA